MEAKAIGNRIKILPIPGTNTKNSIYNFGDSVGFGLITAPSPERFQCVSFQTCRAYVIDAIRKQICIKLKGSQKIDVSNCIYRTDTEYLMDLEKVRLLVTSGINKELFKKYLFIAKHMLNIIESFMQWDSTKIVEVDHYGVKNVWLLTGPKEWLSFPYFFSFYTLLIRVVVKNRYLTTAPEINTIYDIEKYLMLLLKEYIVRKECSNDMYLYISKIYNKISLLFENYSTVFCGSLDYAYCINEPRYSFHSSSGITHLCVGPSIHPNITEQLIAIFKKENVFDPIIDSDINPHDLGKVILHVRHK